MPSKTYATNATRNAVTGRFSRGSRRIAVQIHLPAVRRVQIGLPPTLGHLRDVGRGCDVPSGKQLLQRRKSLPIVCGLAALARPLRVERDLGT